MKPALQIPFLCLLIALIIAIVTLFANAASAKPCLGPSPTSSWGASFPTATTVNGFTYDFVNEIMYVSLPGIIQYMTYLNVPSGTAYAFSNTKTPDQFYKSRIKPVYKVALEAANCYSLLTEDGKFLLVNP